MTLYHAIIEVGGVPAPQGSKQAFVVKGVKPRAVVVEGGSKAGREKHRAWRDTVSWYCQARRVAEGEGFVGAIDVTLSFRMPKVKSDPYRTRHVVKPDLDKLIRSALDSLTASGLIEDDAKVCMLTAHKVYSDTPGLTIEIVSVQRFEESAREMKKRDALLERKGLKDVGISG